MSVVYTISDIAIIDVAICCGAVSSSQFDPLRKMKEQLLIYRNLPISEDGRTTPDLPKLAHSGH